MQQMELRSEKQEESWVMLHIAGSLLGPVPLLPTDTELLSNEASCGKWCWFRDLGGEQKLARSWTLRMRGQGSGWDMCAGKRAWSVQNPSQGGACCVQGTENSVKA